MELYIYIVKEGQAFPKDVLSTPVTLDYGSTVEECEGNLDSLPSHVTISREELAKLHSKIAELANRIKEQEDEIGSMKTNMAIFNQIKQQVEELRGLVSAQSESRITPSMLSHSSIKAGETCEKQGGATKAEVAAYTPTRPTREKGNQPRILMGRKQEVTEMM